MDHEEIQQEIRHLVREGHTDFQIAKRLGIIEDEVRTWKRFHPEHYLPSPEEIASECEEIQAEWSDQERRRRLVGKGEAWKPIVVPESVLTLVTSSATGSSGLRGRMQPYAM